MKPVNLLPASEKPRTAVAAPTGASKAVLVVLGALVLATASYVFVKNQNTDRKAEIAQATQEKQEAEQRAAQLQAFGDFSQIKQTRINSITQLATKRFDWERLMRELALVLPDKVWVTELNGGSAGTSSQSSSAPAPTTATTPGGGSLSVKVGGCAPSQKIVAQTMVRLRSLDGAEDVELQSSAAGDTGAGAADQASSSSSEAGCGRRYQFNATVTFKTPEATRQDAPDRVPSRLGGGA